MTNSARSAFIARSSVRRRPANTPGQEGTYIQSLTPLQRIEIAEFNPCDWGWTEAEAAEMDADKLTALKESTAEARTCVYCCVTKTGKPIFAFDDVRTLFPTELDGLVVSELAGEALDFCGMGSVKLDVLLGKPEDDSETNKTA